MFAHLNGLGVVGQDGSVLPEGAGGTEKAKKADGEDSRLHKIGFHTIDPNPGRMQSDVKDPTECPIGAASTVVNAILIPNRGRWDSS